MIDATAYAPKVDHPVVVNEESTRIFEAHPTFKNVCDEDLLELVKMHVPGIESRKQRGQFILPVVDHQGVVNRALCIATLMGTKQCPF